MRISSILYSIRHELALAAATVFVLLTTASLATAALATPALAETSSSQLPPSIAFESAVDDHLLTDDEWATLEQQAREAEERIAAEKAAAEEAARAEAERQAAEQTETERKTNAIQLDLVETSQGSLEENAQKIFSILTAAGIPEINIAGVLGNWEAESMLDPTSIEGVYGEMYFVGSQKAAAIANPSAYAQKLFVSYASSGIRINENAYVRANGEVWPGVGIGGFTGPAIDPLVSWANRIGKPWYSLETQVSYAIHGYARAGWLTSWTTPETSCSAAAGAFLRNWEGCYVSYANRAANAEKWYSKMANWKADLEYGQSVLALG